MQWIKIRETVQKQPAESGARQIGEVVLMIAGASAQAAEDHRGRPRQPGTEP